MNAHNLDFDGTLIICYLNKIKRYRFGTFMRNTRIYKLEIGQGHNSIIFLCSYKLFPLSLERLAEDFTKLKMPYPYNYIKLDTLYYKGFPPSAF